MIKLSEILKNINEAKQVGNLYHFTSLENIKDIIKSTYLIPNDEGQISTSVRANMTIGDIGKNNTQGKNIVRITLDGNKISNKYKIRPLDYEGEDLGEEQIVTDGKNFPFLPYLKRIDLFIIKPKDKKIETTKKLLDSVNIPYKEYQGLPINNTPFRQPKDGNLENIRVDQIPKYSNFLELYNVKQVDNSVERFSLNGKYNFTIGSNIRPLYTHPDYPGYYINLIDNNTVKFIEDNKSKLLYLDYEFIESLPNYYQPGGKEKIEKIISKIDKNKAINPIFKKISIFDNPKWKKQFKNLNPNSPNYQSGPYYDYYELIPKDKIITKL
jgi:hypothetical protein